MPFRSPAGRLATLLMSTILLAATGLLAVPGRCAEFVDSAGRHVMLPDHVNRVMAAGPAAAVLIFVLSPQKLVGWTEPLSRSQRSFLPSRFARLPVVGRLSGPNPTATAGDLARWRPDLIIDSGIVSPQATTLADTIQRQTHIPYIVLDGSIQRTPEMLRTVGLILEAGDHSLDVASYAFHAIQNLRGRLLIQSPVGRPTVYLGLGSDGLETGLADSAAMSDIDQAGAIPVAASLGRGESTRVAPAQILAWNPSIVIAQQRSFYNALLHDPRWRSLAAVRGKRVYLAPSDPFGWIGDPAGVNRMVGLYWLSDLLYPDVNEEDLRTTVREFYRTFYGVQLTDRQLEALVRSAEAKPGEFRGAATVSIYGAEPPPLPNLSPGEPPSDLGLPAAPTRPPGRGSLPNNPPTMPGSRP